MGIESVTERIHANVGWDGSNVVCIDTAEGVVLVDTPMLPKDIAQWKEFVLGLNPKGIRYIVITHSHFAVSRYFGDMDQTIHARL